MDTNLDNISPGTAPLTGEEAKRVLQVLKPLIKATGIPLNNSQTLVNWRQKQIPYKWHYALITEAEREGIPLTQTILSRYGLNRGKSGAKVWANNLE